MKNTIIFLFLASAFTTAAQPAFNWAKHHGSSADDAGYSVAMDAFGNVYTTGYFQGTVDFDPGPGTANLISAGIYDIFVTKLDPSGNLIWARRIGGNNIDWAYSMAIDASDNVYITGRFAGTADFDPGPGTFNLTAPGGFDDAFLVKLDASGNLIWAFKLGGSSIDEGHALALDASGNIYLTGRFAGTVDLDPGPGTLSFTAYNGSDDIFVVKLDPAGYLFWAGQLGGNAADVGWGISVDGAGNVYTTGYFWGTADFDPGPGSYNFTSFGNGDIYISKLNASGNFAWAVQLGSTSDDLGHALTVDGSGNLYATGLFRGTVDFDPGPGNFNLTVAGGCDAFISRLDSSGNFAWAKQLGGSSNDNGLALTLDNTGDVFTSGYFESTADFDPGPGTFNLNSNGSRDVFVSHLDAAGNFQWAIAFGDVSNDEANDILIDNNSGGIYTTGLFQGTSDFDHGSGTFNLTSAGIRDIFLHKMGGPMVGQPGSGIEGLLTIYPNPCTGKFTIRSMGDLEICNALGDKNFLKKLFSVETEIDLSGFPAGIYFLRVRMDGAIYTQKVIVQ
ncbi:MAG: SBBP repeat-containing protein [Bacteroidota bacterium]